MTDTFKVTHQAHTKPPVEWAKGKLNHSLFVIGVIGLYDRINFYCSVNAIADYILSEHFQDKAREHPQPLIVHYGPEPRAGCQEA